MNTDSYEARVNLALQALENDRRLSIRAAARTHNVSERTVRRRLPGNRARSDLAANSRNLTDSEEETIVRYVLDMSARFFPPRLGGVRIWQTECCLRVTRRASGRTGRLNV